MTTVAVRWVFAGLLLALPPAARAGLPGGVGVMGDSYCDEYQFYPPDRSTARNWVEILAATRGVNFGRFSTSSRGEPRNQGYAYNWARSDATTDSLLASGQHTGLAAQVRRGEVGLVYVFIGGNDFINALHSPEPLAALGSTLPRAVENYRVAVRTVLDASPDVRMLLATLPDVRDLPEFAVPLREGRLPAGVADAFTSAMRRYNARIREVAAAERRVAVLDLEWATRLADRFTPNRLVVGGRKLDRLRPSNDIHHLFLADVRHPGTLGQGVVARMFVDTVNARFGAGLKPIDDRELVSFAVALTAPPAPRDGGVRLADFEPDPARVGMPTVVPVADLDAKLPPEGFTATPSR